MVWLKCRECGCKIEVDDKYVGYEEVDPETGEIYPDVGWEDICDTCDHLADEPDPGLVKDN